MQVVIQIFFVCRILDIICDFLSALLISKKHVTVCRCRLKPELPEEIIGSDRLRIHVA